MRPSIIKSVASLGLMLAMGTFSTVRAQSVDMSLTGSPSGGGVYPGYIYSAQMNASFFSGASTNIPALSVWIQFSLPTGAQFAQTYPNIPAGWSYVYSDAQNVYLQNESTIPLLTNVTFAVPFNVVNAITAPAPGAYNTIEQITIISPNITDPNYTNNVVNTTISVVNQPLAIQLASFNATMQDCKGELKWVTLTELNNAYFDVERSTDGEHFSSIGQVKGAGTSYDKKEYSFEDANPVKGTDFYKIRQVDVSGKATTSDVQSIRMNCQDDNIDVYPNPTTGILYIKGLKDKTTIEVINVLGQKVLTKETQNSEEGLNMISLIDGSYQINVVNSAQKIIFTTKVVKKQ